MKEVIGFYGAENSLGELSNMYLCRFTVNGCSYNSMEQYIRHAKAMLFDDIAIANEIMFCSYPKRCMRLGRMVHNFDAEVWEAKKEERVLPGIYAKFSQNTDLKEVLLNTGDAILCECTPRNNIWGIGMCISNPNHRDPAKWKGKNFQGYLLMKVRDMLRVSEVTTILGAV